MRHLSEKVGNNIFREKFFFICEFIGNVSVVCVPTHAYDSYEFISTSSIRIQAYNEHTLSTKTISSEQISLFSNQRPTQIQYVSVR